MPGLNINGLAKLNRGFTASSYYNDQIRHARPFRIRYNDAQYIKNVRETVAVEVDAGSASLNRTDSNSFNLGVEDYLLQHW